MTLGEKVKRLREYKRMTADEFGAVLGLKRQSVHMIESNNRGLNFYQIKDICQKLKIDSHYFFENIENPAEADLTLPGVMSDHEAVKQLLDKIKQYSPDEQDPVAYRVSINQPLRSIVEKLIYLDGSVLNKLDGYISGYLASLTEQEQPRERPAQA